MNKLNKLIFNILSRNTHHNSITVKSAWFLIVKEPSHVLNVSSVWVIILKHNNIWCNNKMSCLYLMAHTFLSLFPLCLSFIVSITISNPSHPGKDGSHLVYRLLKTCWGWSLHGMAHRTRFPQIWRQYVRLSTQFRTRHSWWVDTGWWLVALVLLVQSSGLWPCRRRCAINSVTLLTKMDEYLSPPPSTDWNPSVASTPPVQTPPPATVTQPAAGLWCGVVAR